MRNAVLPLLAPSLLVALLVAGLACDSANPVAPTGTILTISASPTQIGLNGESVITVVGRRPNGDPLNPGVEISFTTSLGNIQPLVPIGDNGAARAILRADGRSGTATVAASLAVGGSGGGGGDEEGAGSTAGTTASIDVQIGETGETRPSLILTATPNTVFVGEESQITVIARAADGSPLEAGRTVILTTTLGSLDPQRPVTGADGTATAVLNAGDQAGTATVTGIVGTSDPTTTDVTIRDTAFEIDLIPNPPTIQDADSTVELTVSVTNAQGVGIQQAQVRFSALDEGSVDPVTAFTNTNGVVTATFSVQEENIQSGDVLRVQATTAGADGQISDTATIEVQ